MDYTLTVSKVGGKRQQKIKDKEKIINMRNFTRHRQADKVGRDVQMEKDTKHNTVIKMS